MKLRQTVEENHSNWGAAICFCLFHQISFEKHAPKDFAALAASFREYKEASKE